MIEVLLNIDLQTERKLLNMKILTRKNYHYSAPDVISVTNGQKRIKLEAKALRAIALEEGRGKI
ncbi:MAG: hypothetical protein Q9172_003394 [Xanthocarpia lactea]